MTATARLPAPRAAIRLTGALLAAAITAVVAGALAESLSVERLARTPQVMTLERVTVTAQRGDPGSGPGQAPGSGPGQAPGSSPGATTTRGQPAPRGATTPGGPPCALCRA